jgi:hypothetical protein
MIWHYTYDDSFNSIENDGSIQQAPIPENHCVHCLRSKHTQAEGPMRTATLLAAALFLTSPLAKAQNAEPCLGGVSILISDLLPLMKGPFTAVIKETLDQKLADGNSIHGTVRYRIARDAAGRSMSEMPASCYTGEDGHRHQSYQVNVHDRSTNTTESWALSGGQSKIATIFHMPTPQRPSQAEITAMTAEAHLRQAAAAMSQWQTETLGTREFLGVSATGIRQTETIPAGEEGNALPLIVVHESWFSRDLNITLMAIRDDPRRGRTTAEIEELHRGDPDPAIFSPPDGYIIKEQNPTPAVTDPR